VIEADHDTETKANEFDQYTRQYEANTHTSRPVGIDPLPEAKSRLVT